MSKEGRCITAELKKDRTSSDKNKYYWMWREEKKKVEELEAELTRAKEDHQFDNIVHQQELESLRKK
jgi:hypothetical protein